VKQPAAGKDGIPELPNPEDIEVPDAFHSEPAPDPDEGEDYAPVEDEDPEDDPDDDEDSDEDDDDPVIEKNEMPQNAFEAVRKARRNRREARQEARTAREEAQALREELEALKAEKEDPEPDDDASPAEIKAWAKRDAERRLKVRQAPAPGPAQTSPEARRIGALADEMRSRHRDYDDVVNPATRNLINTDPKLWKRVYKAENPAKEAYKVGKELLEEDDRPARTRPTTSGAGGYRPAPVRRADPGKLSPEVRRIGRIFGVDDKEMAKGLTKGGRS